MRVLYPGRTGIWRVSFCGGRKTGEPGEKPSEQGREPSTNSTHIRHLAGIEPATHWWEASALTTPPSLPPKTSRREKLLYFRYSDHIKGAAALVCFALINQSRNDKTQVSFHTAALYWAVACSDSYSVLPRTHVLSGNSDDSGSLKQKCSKQ